MSLAIHSFVVFNAFKIPPLIIYYTSLNTNHLNTKVILHCIQAIETIFITVLYFILYRSLKTLTATYKELNYLIHDTMNLEHHNI